MTLQGHIKGYKQSVKLYKKSISMCHIQNTILACQLVTNYIEIRLYLSFILPVKSNNRSLYQYSQSPSFVETRQLFVYYIFVQYFQLNM